MNVLLSATALGCARGGRPILAAVDLELRSGEVLGLLGPNGAGKSSLLRLLAGIEAPDAGAVELRQQSLATLAPRARARALGYLPQNPELHWPMSVRDAVSLGRLPWHDGFAAMAAGRDGDHAAVRRALARCDLDTLGQRAADTLSGGERARMHLARLFAGEHDVLLVDEPIANLDPRYQLAVLDLLAGHARDPGGGARAVIAVLHDLALAARYCDRVVVLDGGRVYAAGAPAEVLDGALLQQVFGVGSGYADLSGLTAALDARASTAPHRL